jgi:SAM-dependent methyltransferase
MAIDARDAAEFYETELGCLAAGLLRQALLGIWPDCARMSVLGLGFTAPYLSLWRPQAARCVALGPHHMGAHPWPAGHAEEDQLPFGDLSFDRILLVHGLEQADNARRTLREAWRVLADDGRLVVVAPNRRGLWAYSEATPFGHGQPYSEGQLARLLATLFFTPEQKTTLLFPPPLAWRPLLRAYRHGSHEKPACDDAGPQARRKTKSFSAGVSAPARRFRAIFSRGSPDRPLCASNAERSPPLMRLCLPACLPVLRRPA